MRCGQLFILFQSIINLCIALGFLAHGYATGEFEVTIDRLGCYLPVGVYVHRTHTLAHFNFRQST